LYGKNWRNACGSLGMKRTFNQLKPSHSWIAITVGLLGKIRSWSHFEVTHRRLRKGLLLVLLGISFVEEILSTIKPLVGRSKT